MGPATPADGGRPLRRWIPARARRILRTVLREAPVLLRDLPSDARGWLRPNGYPVPPARLRLGVGRTTSREEYLAVGSQAAADIEAAVGPHLTRSHRLGKWLDFGCGPGRIAAALLKRMEIDLVGVDVDQRAIRWARKHIGAARFMASPVCPPIAFEAAHFDVVYCVSVFTHLSEPEQFEWLSEVRRLLRPGGLFVVSTHGSGLLWSLPDLSSERREELRDTGYLFVAERGGPSTTVRRFTLSATCGRSGRSTWTS
jgi:SAM-dependent methyltransferase